MATDLFDNNPASTYGDLLHVDNSGTGLDGTLRSVYGGRGNTSPLQLSTGYVNIAGVNKLKLNSTTILASGAEINYLQGVTSGIQAQLNAKASISYVDTQDAATLAAAQAYTDAQVLDTNVDEDSGDANLIYVGEAPTGSATASASWRIKRLDFTSGLVTTYADGNTNFDNIYDNREALIYS